MNPVDTIASSVAAARALLDQLLAFLPSLLGAAGLLALGWLLGRVLSRGSTKLIDKLAPGLEERATRLTTTPLGIERRLAEVVGSFVFWVVLVIFAAAATEALGLPVLATWVGRLSTLLPQVFVGGLIVLAGMLIGSLTRDAVATAARASGIDGADVLGRVAQVAVVVAAIVTGIDQIGIDSQFVTAMLTVTVGGALGGTALAFALGARTEVSNIIAMHYVRQRYRPGQLIKLDDIRGRIRDFTKTTVILTTGDGQLHIPARRFSDQVTEVLSADS